MNHSGADPVITPDAAQEPLRSHSHASRACADQGTREHGTGSMDRGKVSNSPSTPTSSTSTREPRTDMDGQPDPRIANDAAKLRTIADWFDLKDDRDDYAGSREVQADLRRIARQLDGLVSPVVAAGLPGPVDQVERLTESVAFFAQRFLAVVARADAAEAKVRAVELLRVWTNEDGRRFVFADDLAVALGIPGAEQPIESPSGWIGA